MTNSTPWQSLARLARQHFNIPVEADNMRPICQGASGRSIARLETEELRCIAIYWTNDRADNASFVPIDLLLHHHGIRVPRILVSGTEGEDGMALVQDLGDINLLSFKESNWAEKREYYIDALKQVDQLHRIKIPPEVELQPPFDQNMYRWEQEYFAQHFLQGCLGKNPGQFLNHPACVSLASSLAALPRRPIHRDFQSQNIHILDGRTWFIDFQGMRPGLPEYDLASLIYDPYAKLAPNERQDLLDQWEQITQSPVNTGLLQMCALQRIMQALGAYAKLSMAGNHWYADHIAPAAKILYELSRTSLLAEPLSCVVEYPAN